MHPGLEGVELGAIQPAPANLVGEGGVGEAVAHHPAPGGERGLDARGQVLAARGEHQHGLGLEVHRLVQQQLAQALAERRAAGLASLVDVDAGGLQQRHHRGDLAALAGAVDAFEGDEAAAGGRGGARSHGGGGVFDHVGVGQAWWHPAHPPPPLRMYLLTARLWAARSRENSLLPSPRATK